jgi:hypothetical protein
LRFGKSSVQSVTLSAIALNVAILNDDFKIVCQLLSLETPKSFVKKGSFPLYGNNATEQRLFHLQVAERPLIS